MHITLLDYVMAFFSHTRALFLTVYFLSALLDIANEKLREKRSFGGSLGCRKKRSSLCLCHVTQLLRIHRHSLPAPSSVQTQLSWVHIEWPGLTKTGAGLVLA